MDIQASGVDTWLLLNRKPLHFHAEEDTMAEAIEDHKNTLQVTRSAPRDISISVDNEEIQTYYAGRWDWYPKDYAGLYLLEVSAPGYPLYTAKVRVWPKKLSQERYEVMLTEISEIAADLLFSINSPAREQVVTRTRQERPSALRDYHLIQPLIYKLRNVLPQIRRNPLLALQEHDEQRLLYEIHQFSGAVRPLPGPTIVLPEKVASITGLHYLPERWSVQESALTYDVYENRLLKHFIGQQLLPRLNNIRTKARAEIKRREQERELKWKMNWHDDETSKIEGLEDVIEECQKMTKWCVAWKNELFLTAVKSVVTPGRATQFLLKNPFYSRFYRLYLDFQRELKLSLDTEKYITSLSLRKMSELYEFWSVFQATQIIIDLLQANNYHITSQRFYTLEQDHFQFDVKKRVAGIILTKNEWRVEIKYEPLYPKFEEGMDGLVSTDYGRLTPDMGIEIYYRDKVRHVIIFDAKYRYKQIGDGSFQPLEENLGKMGKYRSKICYKGDDPQNPRQRPQKVVTSSYILYPGTYLEHDRYEPEVGALPLVPTMAQDERLRVEKAIKDILWFAELL
jgi:predicted component of viral defense system (DUF524 family)